jgi:hypothetical protein
MPLKSYGYIDKQGKTVIPPQFNDPGSLFSCGLAEVTVPKSASDRQSDEPNAYINRVGNGLR